MYHVEISRPEREDKQELHLFFRTVITDAFAREGLAELTQDIESEIQSKIAFLDSDLASNGHARYFLIAREKASRRIIGTVEYGPASELIASCTGGELQGLPEIGTVFVHPEYQRRGIGSLLLNLMICTLQARGIGEFCLDSGYKEAQKVWKKRLGEPNYVLRDYWGDGFDHLIWKRSTREVPIIL